MPRGLDFGSIDKSQRIPLRTVPWKRIGNYFKPYRLKLGLVIVVIITTTILNALQPVMMKWIVDKALAKQDEHLLNVLTIGILGLLIVSSLFGVLQTYMNAWIGEAVMNDLRVELYTHIQQMPIDFFTRTKTGDIMSRMTNDVQQLQGVVTQTYGMTINNIFTVLTTVITMYAISPKLTIVSLVVIPLFILPTRRVGKITFRMRKTTQAKISEMSSHIGETLSLSGALLIKLFGRQQHEIRSFTLLSNEIRELDMKQTLIGRWFFMFVGIISSAGPAIIYFVGGHHFFGNPVSIGTMVAFTVFLTRLFQPISSLANTGVSVYSSVALFDRLFEYLDLVPDIQDSPEARDIQNPRGHIQFRQVNFSYEPDRLSLKQIDLEAKPGQLIALVGPSGSGKTTIASLVARLYDPSSGQVLLDGMDLREIHLSSIADAVGMVTQDTFLFHASIAENLRFANPEATDEQLIAAAKAAYIHDFIMSLSNGYETIVGERGHRLSGGEKQRLSIARVILKNPRIVVLDEATSALDSTSERAVQDALTSLLQGRTAIVIAHRLSTIVNADCIYVIEQGQVREQGTHEELLQQGGLYKKLFEEQFAKALEDARTIHHVEG